MKLTRDMIPVGHACAISRRGLCSLTGMNDREVRRQISALRAENDPDGMIIVSVSTGNGYYRTNDIDEIEHFVNEMRHRNRMTYRAIKTAESTLRHLKAKQAHGGELG